MYSNFHRNSHLFSRPETLKRDSSTDIFQRIMCIFSKTLYRTPLGGCSCSSLLYNQGFIHWSHFFHFFPSFFPFIVNSCNYESFFRKGITNEDFFCFLQYMIYPKTWMLLRQFCLGINLSMHIRENADFPWQKTANDNCWGKFWRL